VGIVKGCRIFATKAQVEKKKEVKKPGKKLIFGRFKPRFFLIVGILIIIIVGIFFLFNIQLGPPSTSTILSCTANSCQTGYYCSSFGACLKSVCGDGICSTQEKANNSCPIDCGCGSGYVLNKYTNQCQMSLTISNANITTVVDNYLHQNKINGTITNITNGYYGSQSVKEVFVNCALPNVNFPCQMTFYINSTIQIINVTRTD